MNFSFHDFHFLRPWWLLVLAALPLLWRALSSSGADAGAWRGVVDAHLLPHLLDLRATARSSRVPRWLATFAWIVACVALAGPAWERLPQPLFQNRAARVFALELSPSMSAQDIKPSRYERARYKLDDMLAHSGGMQTGLADGSVRNLGRGITLPTYQAACNPADGLVLGSDWNN